MARKAVRGWHFWRAAFWTRPALLLLYALLVTTLAAGILLSVPQAIADGRAIAHGEICRSVEQGTEPDDCLREVPGTLDGPWFTRGPGSSWHFLELDDRSLAESDEFDASSIASGRLEEIGDDRVVTGLYFEGQVIAIEGPDGRLIVSDEYGHQRWMWRLYIGMFTLGGALMLVNAARLKRSTSRGWWSVDGESVLLMPLSPLIMAASLLVAPALLGLLPLFVADSVPVSAVAFLAGLALVLFAVVKQRAKARR